MNCWQINLNDMNTETYLSWQIPSDSVELVFSKSGPWTSSINGICEHHLKTLFIINYWCKLMAKKNYGFLCDIFMHT